MTKEVCAEVMGMELVEDPHTRQHIEEFFHNNIYREIPANNWKMTTVPRGARVLDNHNGMAPGLILEKDGKTAILLPGPPGELYPMFEQQVFPYLETRENASLVSKTLKICGHGESQVAVSYTHLDVYKRQHRDLVRLRQKPRAHLSEPQRHPPASEGAAPGAGRACKTVRFLRGRRASAF